MSFERWKSDGDWTIEPWFLRSDGGWLEEWRVMGLPLDIRRQAVEGLRRIFSPEACRVIRDDASRSGYGRVIALFDGVRSPTLVAPMLELGLAARKSNPWEDRGLIHRLRLRDGHDEAAFEVHVHAALLGAGFAVQRVPESSSRRTPDFKVTRRGVTFDMELKLLNSSALDGIAEDLNWLLSGRDLTLPGLRLTLCGSESFAEQALDDPKGVRQRLGDIADAFGRIASRIRASPVVGTYEVAGYGSILAEAHDGQGVMTDLVLPDLSEEKKAQRVLRLVRKGLSQFDGTHSGVLVVGLSRFANPFWVEHLVLKAARHDDAFGRCKMVVLRDTLNDPPGTSRLQTSFPIFHAFSPHGYRRLRKAELELADAVGASSTRPAARLRPPAPGEEPLRGETRRPARSLVRLGTIRDLNSGDKVVFTLKGNGQTTTRIERGGVAATEPQAASDAVQPAQDSPALVPSRPLPHRDEPT
ncbi:hypothetical protein [Corallococcus sp. AB038B]|uniref:hypothetical protein n=1 Tax=Corallococcus sp. AB038B TaxID=2316718 RepID=UPI000EEB31BB|nr:hypothetical protein [Corallococcus sp. AB038B]RKI01740.1 hypothetical protein D7Y04_14615 [Corallococcus sp. AB038B]